jgi:hypothetical protein
VLEGIRDCGLRVAHQGLDGSVGIHETQVGEADRQQAVEGVVHFDREALELSRPRDAGAPVGELRGVARGAEAGERLALEDVSAAAPSQIGEQSLRMRGVATGRLRAASK